MRTAALARDAATLRLVPGDAGVAGPGRSASTVNTLARCDGTLNRIIRRAVTESGGSAQLSVEHLFRSLMAVDGSVLLRKLRPLQAALRSAIRRTPGPDGRPESLAAIRSVLHLAEALAAAPAPINTQHLLVAILLEGTNDVAREVRASGVDLERLLIAKFACLPNLRSVLGAAARGQPEPQRPAAHTADADALSRALEALRSEPWLPPPAPTRAAPPPATPAPPPPLRYRPWAPATPRPLPSAEETARRWLRKLIPGEAERYSQAGFVEVGSVLFPQRRYRIYGDGRNTRVLERDRIAGLNCLQLKASDLPPTDRVIAEYFLIRGDERAYLETANTLRF